MSQKFPRGAVEGDPHLDVVEARQLIDLLSRHFATWDGSSLLCQNAGLPERASKGQNLRDFWAILVNALVYRPEREPLSCLLAEALEFPIDPEERPALEAIAARLVTARLPAVGSDEPGPTRPYPGLEPFSPADRAVFFGREGDLARLLVALEHRPAPLTLLTGPSGAGKTSLLHAGLRPRLPGNLAPALFLDAGLDPLEAIGRAVLAAPAGTFPRPLASVEDAYLERLRSSARRLATPGAPDRSPALLELLTAAANLGAPLLLVIDRLDDLLATHDEQTPAPALEEWLTALELAFASASRPAGRILLAIRREHLGPLDRWLSRRLNPECWKTFHLAPLAREALREALEGPARASGREGCCYRPFSWAPDAAVALAVALAESGHVPSAALQLIGGRLYDALPAEPTAARVITLEHIGRLYPGTGQPCTVAVSEALRDHLERTLAVFAAPERGLVELVLRDLVAEGQAGPVARACTWSALREGFEPRDQRKLGPVMARLKEARIVVREDTGLVRLAHDALAEPVSRIPETRLAAPRARRIFLLRLDRYWKTGWWRRSRHLLSGDRYTLVHRYRRRALKGTGLRGRWFMLHCRWNAWRQWGWRWTKRGLVLSVLLLMLFLGGVGALRLTSTFRVETINTAYRVTGQYAALEQWSEIERVVEDPRMPVVDRARWLERRLATLRRELEALRWDRADEARLLWGLRIAASRLETQSAAQPDPGAVHRGAVAKRLARQVRSQVAMLQHERLGLKEAPAGERVDCTPEQAREPSAACERILIPEGPFFRGGSGRAESPAGPVWLSAFLMDRLEVSNETYRAFVEAGGPAKSWPGSWVRTFAPTEDLESHHPVIGVDYYDAAAYCEWVGGALPDEAQWEKSARGPLCPAGVPSCPEAAWNRREWPWGDGKTVVCGFGDYKCPGSDPSTTRAVGSYREAWTEKADPAWYGVEDLAGNVREWTRSWYDPTGYRALDERSERYEGMPGDPPGAGVGDPISHAIRGSSYLDDSAWSRVAFRLGNLPTYRYNDVGFRCVSRAPPAFN